MKYILLTGVSGGIGRSIAEELLAKDYYVIGTDIIKSDLNHPNFNFIKCDLTSKIERFFLKEKVKKITNHLDVIGNIAGMFMMESMQEGSEEDLRQIMEVNFFAVYNLNKLMFDFLDHTSKVIILTSEVARYSPQPFNGYYSLSKRTLDFYVDILRREYNYFGIKVIKIQSGAIKTNLLTGVNDKYQHMVDSSVYYKEPLTKLKKLMDNEINKQASPTVISKLFGKIVISKHPKTCYRIRNSFKLRFLNSLPEKLQDKIYVKVIK